MDLLRRFSRGGRLLLALVVGGGVFAIASAVYADVPDGGVIHGCLKSNGDISVIDTSAGATCRATETSLNWNQTGPAGATGATGPTGSTGQNGTNGTNGNDGTSATTSTGAASCANGGITVHSASPDVAVCNGTDGTNGSKGDRGPTGPTGAAGPVTETHGLVGVMATGAPQTVVSMNLGPGSYLLLADVHVINGGNDGTWSCFLTPSPGDQDEQSIAGGARADGSLLGAVNLSTSTTVSVSCFDITQNFVGMSFQANLIAEQVASVN
jgi:hypothetical protein